MREFTIKWWVKALAWVSASIIVYLNISLVIDEITAWITSAGDQKIYIYLIVIPIALTCLALLVYIFVHPMLKRARAKIPQLPHGGAEDLVVTGDIAYRHIGITIDFSGNDQKIIQNAVNQGGASATYTLIHVVESAAARYLGKNTRDFETLADKDNLVKYQNTLIEQGYQANLRIGFGGPVSEIIRIVKEEEIDLLVMGAHGHRGFKDLVFGTTVDKVRHKIHIPLLIIN